MGAKSDNAAPCGVLLVDKPAGWTSHDVVGRLRRWSGVKKVGHAGTLDPFATGLLLVLVGRATRLFDFFSPLEKRYRVTLQLGAFSSTDDVEGELEPVEDGRLPGRSRLEAALARFRGRIRQRPPAYSAVKVGGEPLYRKARRGEAVAAPERQVEIYRLELEGYDRHQGRAVLDVTCSGGTYVRSLCRDVGAALGCGGYARELRRLAVGRFDVGDALSPRQLEQVPPPEVTGTANTAFISCLGALYFLPVRELDPAEVDAVRHGRPIAGTASGPVRLAAAGRLVAVYGPGDADGLIYPRVVLA